MREEMIGERQSVAQNRNGKEPHPLFCPACAQSDRAEKASSVVRRNSGLVLDTGSSQQVRQFITGLARALSLPDEPKATPYSEAGLRSLVAIVVAGAALLIIAGLRAQSLLTIPSGPLNAAELVAIGWFLIAMPAFIFMRAFLEQRAARAEMPAWQEARRRWEGLYYCSRDDVVFLAGAADVRPPERMSELLFTEAPLPRPEVIRPEVEATATP